MNYQSLINQINANITSNNANQITGEVFRNVLAAMVTSLGRGYQFMGFATPTTNPGTPDQKVFYIAQTDGEYINFGNLQVVGITFLFWDTQWSATQLNVSSGGGGGGTGLTSIGLNMPTMFSVDPSTPLTANGTFNVSLKSDYTIPVSTEWNDVYNKRHSHANKSILDGITSTEISHWNEAYNAIGTSGSTLPFNAPVVRVLKGDKANTAPTHPYASFLRVDHPLLEMGGEVVLMVWNKRNKKKLGNERFETNNSHWPRKGWFVARGWRGNDTWTVKPSPAKRKVYTRLYDLQAYIIRHYTQLGSQSRTYMESLSYINWCNAAETASFGYDDGSVAHRRKSPKLTRKFGIAVRILNPVWTEYAGGSPTQWTQDVVVDQITSIPRYLYSPVTPLFAEINANSDTDTYNRRLGLTPM